MVIFFLLDSKRSEMTQKIIFQLKKGLNLVDSKPLFKYHYSKMALSTSSLIYQQLALHFIDLHSGKQAERTCNARLWITEDYFSQLAVILFGYIFYFTTKAVNPFLSVISYSSIFLGPGTQNLGWVVPFCKSWFRKFYLYPKQIEGRKGNQ